jgi:hypothetical protein
MREMRDSYEDQIKEQEERVEEMIDAISHHVEVINGLKGDLRENSER